MDNIEKRIKGKRVLITGITGFIGSYLASRLESLNAEVYGISRKTAKKNYLHGSVTNFSALSSFIKEKKIDICFHLAAASLVETGQKNPYYTFKSNIQSTLNVLECARKHKLERVIIASSSHVYGDNKPPYHEELTPKPSRPYETSKACTDLIAQSYVVTYNLPVLISRFVNVYGPRDYNFTRLIPRTIKSVIAGNSPEMWSGSAMRDFLYIEDAIQAYLYLATCDFSLVGKNRIFNFGSGNVLSVKEIVEKIISLSGKNVSIKHIENERKAEVPTQFVSFEKSQKIFHWQPKYSIDEGLKKTYSWYEQYFTKKNDTS